MLKKQVFVITFILLIGIIALSGMRIAACETNSQAAIEKFIYCHRQDPIKIANDYLDQLQNAYQTKNLVKFIRLYNNPVVTIDAVNNINEFYNRERLNDEIGEMFQTFSGITCIFENRQITFEGDMIMIRTMRSFSANEFSFIAKCEMIMVLRQPFNERQPWNFVATDQTMMSEEYIPKPSPGNKSLNTLTAPALKNNSIKTNHLFW